MPRMGAIAIGGIAGLVLGLRGRKFKRIMYSSAGALSMAAICYPKKAKEGFVMAKHYVNVGYNFIYGGNGYIKLFSAIYFCINNKCALRPSTFKKLKTIIDDVTYRCMYIGDLL